MIKTEKKLSNKNKYANNDDTVDRAQKKQLTPNENQLKTRRITNINYFLATRDTKL